MNKEQISIIVPCFNVEKYIDDCFLSLKKQTYKNFEVIFVNDGSTDCTLEKIEEFCEEDKRFRFIDQTNQGVSVARNTGIANSNGEFVCFVDSDDLISPFYLEILHDNLTKYNCDFSVSAFKWTKESFSYKNVKKKIKRKKVVFFQTKEENLTQLLSSKLFSFGPVKKLYKQVILEKMEGYPNLFNQEIAYGEDVDFNFRYLTQIKNKTVYSPEILYYYRQRKGSAVKSSFKEKMLSIFLGWKENLKICEKEYPTVEKYVRANMCISSIEMLLRIFVSDYNNPEIVNKLYVCLKENKKFLSKSKKIQFYKRWFIPITPPIIKILMRKKFKMPNTKRGK